MAPRTTNPTPDDEGEDTARSTRDPMQELFGPGSGVFADPEEDSNPPDELIAIFDEFGIRERSYRCILKEIGTGANNTYVKSFNHQYPSMDWITNNCGPGEYLLVFQWREQTGEKTEGGHRKTINRSEQVPVTISEKALSQWREYQFQQKIKKLAEKRQQIQDAKIDRALDVDLSELEPKGSTLPAPPPVDPAEAGKAYVKNIVEAASMLGLSRAPQPSMDWGKLLAGLAPLALPLFEFFKSSREAEAQRQREFTQLLLTTMAGSHSQVLELAKVQNGQGAGSGMAKEYLDILRSAIDIKQEISGMGKESIADKVFGLLEGLAGHVVPLLMMNAQQRASDPRMMIAKVYRDTSPDIAELKMHPEELQKLVVKLDAYYGWAQTDGMLAIMGFERPVECVRDPGKQWPDGDPRNVPNPAPEGATVPPPAARNASTPLSDHETEGEFTED